jgi:hypothetical protein
MKTKLFFLLSVFLVSGFVMLSAQDLNSSGNGSIVTEKKVNLYVPVYCDDVLVDELLGTISAHWVRHYKNGVVDFTIIRASGELTSIITGEKFQDMEFIKMEVPKPGFVTSFDNIKGDKGALYNISLIIDWPENTWVVKNATCTGNVK